LTLFVLVQNDFECFPEDVAHLVVIQLQRIYWGNIPVYLLQTNLQILVLRENDIIDLPKQLGACQKLKELHIQGNRLQVIPPELGALDLIDPHDENAKTLRVENNPSVASGMHL
jgi:hypothetical protein